ncbi:hypothetical protein EAE96_011432 [Botrytis aclada]|nr:hypothetical protein EAE96_011432 [Botrytis aclada]
MAPLHALAIITPAPGKEARLREVMIELGKKVEENEQGVLRYQSFEQYDGEKGNVFVVQEIYEDEAALAAHMVTPHFIELGKVLSEEGLLGAPLDIKKIQPFAGFASR